MNAKEKAILLALIEATIPNCDVCQRPAHRIFFPQSAKKKIGNVCLSPTCLGDIVEDKGVGDTHTLSFSDALKEAEGLL